MKPKSPQNLTFLWEHDKVIIEYKPPFSLRCFILEYQYKSDFAEDWVCVQWIFLLHDSKVKGMGMLKRQLTIFKSLSYTTDIELFSVKIEWDVEQQIEIKCKDALRMNIRRNFVMVKVLYKQNSLPRTLVDTRFLKNFKWIGIQIAE